MMVRWLRFCASNEKCGGSNPRGGTKIPHVVWQKKKKKKTERGDRANEVKNVNNWQVWVRWGE